MNSVNIIIIIIIIIIVFIIIIIIANNFVIILTLTLDLVKVIVKFHLIVIFSLFRLRY